MKHLLLIAILFGLIPVSAHAEAGPPTTAVNKAAAVADNNAFATDLYGKLAAQKGNLFFSPASISTCMAMVYAGALGTTQTEMEKAMHFSLGEGGLHKAMGSLLRELNANGAKGDYQLKVANAVWVQNDFKITDSYSDLVKKVYDAGLGSLNFAKEAETSRSIINMWVSERTANKINDLLPPGSINSATRVVLTNAVYFKADWLEAFDKAETKEDMFSTGDKLNVKTSFMHSNASFNHMEGDGFQALELPYKGRDISMVVFLPDAPDGIDDFQGKLNATNLEQWLGQLRHAPKVELALPKFKMAQNFGLGDTLKEMGMPAAFSPEAANFAGMTGKKELFLSAVLHKSYIDVDEEGTEAAAATGAVMTMTAAPLNPPEPVIFRADHPFFFILRDNRSGSILFMGRVSDPTVKPVE